MAKIDSIRLVTSQTDHGETDTMGRHRPELLDVLAAGEPAAFASDSRDRIVFWNRGAAKIFGRRAEEALGRHCWEVVGGHDVFGNRYCHGGCSVLQMCRHEETVSGFELQVPAAEDAEDRTTVQVTLIRLPGPRADLFTAVHLLQPIDEDARLARALERFGPALEAALPPAASGGPGRANGNGRLNGNGNGNGNGHHAVAPPSLTAREREILQCIAAGLQNKEIAQQLELSLATVRNHIHNTLEKLGVHSKLEAVSLAFRNGWVEDEQAVG